MDYGGGFGRNYGRRAVFVPGKPEELGEQPMYSGEARTEEKAEDGIAYRDIFRTPQFYLLAAGYVLVPMAAQGALSNLPPF